jgi:hypothetical protein
VVAVGPLAGNTLPGELLHHADRRSSITGHYDYGGYQTHRTAPSDRRVRLAGVPSRAALKREARLRRAVASHRLLKGQRAERVDVFPC